MMKMRKRVVVMKMRRAVLMKMRKRRRAVVIETRKRRRAVVIETRKRLVVMMKSQSWVTVERRRWERTGRRIAL